MIPPLLKGAGKGVGVLSDAHWNDVSEGTMKVRDSSRKPNRSRKLIMGIGTHKLQIQYPYAPLPVH